MAIRSCFLVIHFAMLLSADAICGISTIREIRSLSRDEALKEVPVALEAVVLYSDPGRSHALIHDGTTSCYLNIEGNPEGIVCGTRLRIRGVTTQFGLFPHLVAKTTEMIGHSQLPEPSQPGADELFLPELDSAWIRVPAVITGVESGGIAYTLAVEVFGHEFKVDLPPVPDAGQRVAALMQRPVMMTAVAGTVFNNQMQMTGRHFFVPSFDQLVPVTLPEVAAEAPLFSTLEILTGTSGPTRMVRIQGVVTQADAKGFYLRDTAGSAFVQTALNGRYPAGTRVEAVGFGRIAPYRPILRATSVRELARLAPPPPRQLVMDDVWTSTLHDELVTVDAGFLGLRQGMSEHILICQAGSMFFEAVVDSGQQSLVEGLIPGDKLRITGICKLMTTHPIPRQEWADGFRILLEGAHRIEILEKAPWWTRKRLYSALGITGLTCAGALSGVMLLRRRVARQVEIIGGKLRDEAIHSERDRMARDLHDTLEQQLAGVSLQIDGIARAASSNPGVLPERVAVARRMIRHTRAEARRSVWDLRSRILETEGLPAALRSMVAAVSDTPGGPVVEIAVGGKLPPLTKSSEFHLLRLAQEALTNALKHSGASEVRIELSAADHSVRLRISDNGTGFDSQTRPTESSHFGMTGMNERAERINARINIESSLGNGCVVTVDLPVDREETPDMS